VIFLYFATRLKITRYVSFLKLVGRQIFQRKGYFVINTIGLAVALTASILIYTFLVKEWQTNSLKNLTSYQFEMIHIVLFLAVLQSTKNHLKISRSLSPNIS